jgi:hypothetical protein
LKYPGYVECINGFFFETYEIDNIKLSLITYYELPVTEAIVIKPLDIKVSLPFMIPSDIKPDTKYVTLYDFFRHSRIEAIHIDFGKELMSGKIHMCRDNLLRYLDGMCGCPILIW